MNEQGIAWMIAGGSHDPSPEEIRQRALRRALADSRPVRPGLRQRFAEAIGGRQPAGAVTLATDCCAA